ncbi:DUF1963 domain-containing protein [Lysinibacillus sp. RC79]|uniref:DUF1963 domain-containing protein n=1 Tax=Lysinibacillus sp. RC79 TaxID=3156296 RepID=UPI00351416CC
MDKLRTALHDFELEEAAEQILQFAKNSIRAIATPTADEEIRMGHSKESINSAVLSFKNEWTLPSWESPDGQKLTVLLTEEQADAYDDFLWRDESERTAHRIDGYPNTIQGDMYLQCELVTNGLYCGDSTGYEHPLRKELEPNVKDWQLLLQLDSEDDLGYMWGDSGRLYFWIREQDCKNKAFDKVWAILQCY